MTDIEGTDDELVECEACGEQKPAESGESVVVHTHRVDGRAVAEDTEWICGDCLFDAEESSVEHAIEARQWRGYDAWEEQARMGVKR